ncbi:MULTISPECIES: HRDC domain-containing protein [unclassified Paenibacillus]|uniref:HRDC domain-containing protein n=1 Tax=unclassified Paenibacillus TaxID=185978 RepID=UPI0036433A75
MMFLNSLEMKVGDDQVRSAQVSISENQGNWFVDWKEMDGNVLLLQESWYEGISLEEMLTVFRTHIFTKQCQGFTPIFDGRVQSDAVNLESRAAQAQLLHYYSEIHVNDELYEQLRQWRLKQSSLEGKSPFLVATNRLLRMICTFLPHSLEELRQLPGLGASKIAAYGNDLLEYTQKHERGTEFPLHWVEAEVDPAKFNAWLQHEKDRKLKAEQNKRDTKRKLLEAITRGDSLDALREQTQLQRRDLLLWIEELDREGYDLEPYIERMLLDVSAEEQELAWAAFELQGDRYLKPVLQALYKQEELEAKEVDRIYEWLRVLRMKFRRVNTVRQAEAG